jgi:hypothetical protein
VTGDSRKRGISDDFRIVDAAPGPDGKNPTSHLPNAKGLTAAINLYLRHFVDKPRNELSGSLALVTTDLIGATATKLEAAKLLGLTEPDEIGKPIRTVNRALWAAANPVLRWHNLTALRAMGRSDRAVPDAAIFQVTGDGFVAVILNEDANTRGDVYLPFHDAIRDRFMEVLPGALGNEMGRPQAAALCRGPLADVGIRWGAVVIPVEDLMQAPDGAFAEATIPGKISHIAAGARTQILTGISNAECNAGAGLSQPLGPPDFGQTWVNGTALGPLTVNIGSGAAVLAGDLGRCVQGSESGLAAGYVNAWESRLDGAGYWNM